MSEREAQELIAKADKKAASSSWFFGGNKYEEAAELYTKAGNIYKMAKRCRS
jgi:alpha-soluble NSF attachment protein